MIGCFECVEIDRGLSRRSLTRFSEHRYENSMMTTRSASYLVEYFDMSDDGAELDWCTCGFFGFARGCRSILRAGVNLSFVSFTVLVVVVVVTTACFRRN